MKENRWREGNYGEKKDKRLKKNKLSGVTIRIVVDEWAGAFNPYPYHPPSLAHSRTPTIITAITMDGPRDGPRDRQVDGRMDKASCRVMCP